MSSQMDPKARAGLIRHQLAQKAAAEARGDREGARTAEKHLAALGHVEGGSVEPAPASEAPKGRRARASRSADASAPAAVAD